jgi:hypothetical protein
MLRMWGFPNCWLNTALESNLFEVKAIAGHHNYSFLYICFWQPLFYYYYYLLKKDYKRFKKRKYIQNHYKSSTTLIEKGHKGQVVTYDIYGAGLLGLIF